MAFSWALEDDRYGRTRISPPGVRMTASVVRERVVVISVAGGEVALGLSKGGAGGGVEGVPDRLAREL